MYEDLKKRLGETTELKTFPDYTNIPVITKWPVHKHGPESIAAIETLEAQLATANARIDELKEALGDICKDSNPDWVEKRVYPNDILDDIHSVAVEAYYSKKHMNKQSRKG